MSDDGWYGQWSESSDPPAKPAAPARSRKPASAAGSSRAKPATRPAPPAAPGPDAAPAPAADPAPQPARPKHRATADDLSPETLLRPRREVPHHGWRATVFRVTRGALNPGPSAAEVRENELLTRVRASVSGCRRIAVISAKGGVGKTTTAATLGATLAAARGDRVIAVDANPDLGTLALRFAGDQPQTVRELLQQAGGISTYADVRAFTSQGSSRLEVLASDTDPAVSDAFSESDYRQVSEILARFYNVMLTDSGTGLLHSAMRGILGLAHSLVVVAGPAVDGARSASATLDWLEAHGLHQLVAEAVVVISTVRPGSGEVDLGRLEEHFRKRVRGVVRVPYDPHLAAGATIDLDRLQPSTRDAYLLMAAQVVDGLTTAGGGSLGERLGRSLRD